MKHFTSLEGNAGESIVAESVALDIYFLSKLNHASAILRK